MIQEVALIPVVGRGETVGYFLPLVARKSWCHSHHLAPPPQLEIPGAAHTFVYLLSPLKGSELTPCKDATDSSELHEISFIQDSPVHICPKPSSVGSDPREGRDH